MQKKKEKYFIHFDTNDNLAGTQCKQLKKKNKIEKDRTKSIQPIGKVNRHNVRWLVEAFVRKRKTHYDDDMMY